MRRLLRTTVALVAALAVVSTTSVALAGPHDLELSRFLEFEEVETDHDRIWGQAEGDDEAFRNLSRDLGQVFAPRLIAPSETLGQAGFAMKFMGSVSNIPDGADYWQRGLEGVPASALYMNHVQVRKGLPFSLEVVGNLGHLAGSQMFAMGADVRFAVQEGYQYFPDVAARGSVNTVTGAPELNMVNAAWDLSMSKSFGLAGVTRLTPYAGYQQLWTVSSTRVLNALPQDPRPPQTLRRDGPQDLHFAPEYVFSQEVQTTNRVFVGTRLNTWILSFTLEGVFAIDDALPETVQQFTFAAGFDF